MRGRLEPKDTVERFWGLKFIGFPNLSDETPKPRAPDRKAASEARKHRADGLEIEGAGARGAW